MDTETESASTPATRRIPANRSVHCRPPVKTDGPDVHRLIAASPPLDPNSLYCNLLQCHHFADTCVVAELEGQTAGFVSGYRLPAEPDALFIWQVAVHQNARGLGLGKQMIRTILQRDACVGVRRLKTTITPGNAASWALFRSLARDLGAHIEEQVEYARQPHFGGSHDDEILLTISPLQPDGGSKQ